MLGEDKGNPSARSVSPMSGKAEKGDSVNVDLLKKSMNAHVSDGDLEQMGA